MSLAECTNLRCLVINHSAAAAEDHRGLSTGFSSIQFGANLLLPRPSMALMPSVLNGVPKLLELCFDAILFDPSESYLLVRELRRKPPKILLEALLKISSTFYPLSLWSLRAAGHDWDFCCSWKTSQCPKMTNISIEKLCGSQGPPQTFELPMTFTIFRSPSDSCLRSLRQLVNYR